ncbi:MAG TPA: hypothetical protein VIH99_05505, partial [Bdellovibrionota bacterium]
PGMTDLVLAAVKEGRPVNCALPSAALESVMGIKDAKAAACLDFNNKPLVLTEKLDALGKPIPGKSSYYPDTNSPVFRQYVASAIALTKAAGCTSLHQDNPLFMYSPPLNAKGCRAKDSQTKVLADLRAYYTWLSANVDKVYKRHVPLTYNKLIHKNGDQIADFFDAVVTEWFLKYNDPYLLYDKIYAVNGAKFHLTTATTLRSRNKLDQQRHIASVYALGGNPIFPWDIFVGLTKERFYGKVADYLDYYRLVQANRALFEGHKLMDAHADGAAGKKAFNRKGLAVSGDDGALLVTLRGNPVNGSRVLHIVNWRATKRDLKILLPTNAFDSAPRSAMLSRPGERDLKLTLTKSGTGYLLSVPGVNVWAVIEIR